jgi:hypothetical protein
MIKDDRGLNPIFSPLLLVRAGIQKKSRPEKPEKKKKESPAHRNANGRTTLNWKNLPAFLPVHVRTPIPDDSDANTHHPPNQYNKIMCRNLKRKTRIFAIYNILAEKKVIPMVLMFYRTVTSCSAQHDAMIPTVVKRMILLDAPIKTLAREERAVLELINDYPHDRID